jgi:peptide/nickel transport system ATP-binding protein
MEVADTVELFEHHAHPYTRFLFDSVEQDVDPFSADAGPDHSLSGCRFAHRCPHAWDQCRQVPPLVDIGAPGHRSACFLQVGELSGPA